jgi:hypothetical protein
MPRSAAPARADLRSIERGSRLMPAGYVVSMALMAGCVLIAVRPPMPRDSSPSNPAFWFGFLVNELPSTV